MLELYHWEPNANSGKPILALLEKGVPFTSHYTDLLNFDQHEPAYLAMNPDGTIPTLVHDGVTLTESSQMGEYIDAVFDGPPLRPADTVQRWRMRYWTKFFDNYFGPSLSMLGWSMFVGPVVSKRDPEELQRKIDRIPLKERRVAWETAIFNRFTPEQLAESTRRVHEGIAVLNSALVEFPYIAGPDYSLADINIFSMTYSLPLMQKDHANWEKAPAFMDWLRRLYARPAAAKCFAYGRTQLAERSSEVMSILKAGATGESGDA